MKRVADVADELEAGEFVDERESLAAAVFVLGKRTAGRPPMEPESAIEFHLEHPSYGKDGVRLIVAAPVPTPGVGGDTVRDITFAVRVEGDSDASYRSGDNAAVLPSDTLRRHLLQAGAAHHGASLEQITLTAAAQIHAANPAFTRALVQAREQPWTRVRDTSFSGGGPIRFASCEWSTSGRGELLGGVEEMTLLATRGSAFSGFYRDELTVQAEAADRPLCASITARWSFAAEHVPTLADSVDMPRMLADALADRSTNAIQQLVTEAGSQLLATLPELLSVEIDLGALPLAPLDSRLAPADEAVRAHEAGPGPLGVTAVALTRP